MIENFTITKINRYSVKRKAKLVGGDRFLSTYKGDRVRNISGLRFKPSSYIFNEIGRKRSVPCVNGERAQVVPMIVTKKIGCYETEFLWIIVDDDFKNCLNLFQTMKTGDFIKQKGSYFEIVSFHFSYHGFILKIKSLIKESVITSLDTRMLEDMYVVDKSEYPKVQEQREKMEKIFSDLTTELEKHKDTYMMVPRKSLGVHHKFIVR